MPTPKSISVIIPVYNDSWGIRLVLEALLDQNYPKEAYEIIVVDNKSQDDTPEVVKMFQREYSGRVYLKFENEIQSSYAARNRGAQLAKGDILAFTDADCIPQVGWLSEGAKALEEQSANCGGGSITFFFGSDKPNIYEYLNSTTSLNQKKYINHGNYSTTANFFIRKPLFDQYKGFLSKLKSGGDYEFCLRLTQGGQKVIYIHNAVVRHPARSTFKALFERNKRVSLGKKQLHQNGLIKFNRFIFFKQRCLRFSCPIDPERIKSLSLIEKVQVVLLNNFFGLIQFLIRIS